MRNPVWRHVTPVPPEMNGNGFLWECRNLVFQQNSASEIGTGGLLAGQSECRKNTSSIIARSTTGM